MRAYIKISTHTSCRIIDQALRIIRAEPCMQHNTRHQHLQQRRRRQASRRPSIIHALQYRCSTSQDTMIRSTWHSPLITHNVPLISHHVSPACCTTIIILIIHDNFDWIHNLPRNFNFWRMPWHVNIEKTTFTRVFWRGSYLYLNFQAN
jgi:hypothetical protein